MNLQFAKEEYIKALSLAKKELRELAFAGKPTRPLVLDEILGTDFLDNIQDIGLVDIPAERILGTKSAGRIASFTPTFRPTLNPDSEFAIKWIHLCQDHLGETGIRDPILCYEYLGNFYVQEGNKRVSVLRHFDAAQIPGHVIRILPAPSEDPRVKAYYEFTEFFKVSRIYRIQFRRPGDYARLLAFLGKAPGEKWSEQERRTFRAWYQYFCEAFASQKYNPQNVLPEEALLLWLQVHPYTDLGEFSSAQLRQSLQALWPDVVASSRQSELKTETEPLEENTSFFSRITSPSHLNVAFVHQLDPQSSAWVLGHEEGRKHLEAVFGSRITVRSYYDANTDQQIEAVLDQALADGAQLVFTTAPRLSRATLKYAVKNPKVRFYNCSVNQPYTSFRTYYGRMYEAKFISGALAGAVSQDNRIGYIGSSPIMGMTASINAFALGAQMTNPRAHIELRWSCCEGNPQADLFREGIRVISNREMPTQNRMYLDFCNYGTYLMDGRGGMIPLGSPVWVWGPFYERIVSAILGGAAKEDRSDPKAVSYWLGMDSGVIDIELSDKLPTGLGSLAAILRDGLRNRTIDPFRRKIRSQDGVLRNDGSHSFTPSELLKMDWLCDNISGEIPSFDQLLPISQGLVRELGIYRDSIPALKEVLK